MWKICLFLSILVGVSVAIPAIEPKDTVPAIKKPDESKVPVPINEPVASGSAVNPREPVAFEEPLDGNDEGLEPAESAWGGGRGWGGGYGRGWGGGWGGGYGRGWGGGWGGHGGGWNRGYGGGWGGGYRRGGWGGYW